MNSSHDFTTLIEQSVTFGLVYSYFMLKVILLVLFI